MEPFFVLAPMDDVTDVVFRSIVAECAAPDMFMTEFVNVDGLQSVGREKLLHRLYKRPREHNVTAQIWGKNPSNYYTTTKELVAMGFAGIDINMGCPDKAVVKNGCCSALIHNRPLAKEIIDAVKSATKGKVPISVKTRTGFNAVDITWIEFLLHQQLDMLTIHGRTKKQMSKVPANWEDIGRARELRDALAPGTKIIGNGDVVSRKHGIELANTYTLDGIMIGRGIFSDPFIFAKESPWPTMNPSQKIALYVKQVELFIHTYKKGERSPLTLKRYAKIYINGFDHAADIREKIMNVISPQDILHVLRQYLAQN